MKSYIILLAFWTLFLGTHCDESSSTPDPTEDGGTDAASDSGGTTDASADTGGNIYGSIQFNASAYPVSETALKVRITVTRTGGTTGAVTVDYATSDGTAKQNEDYDPAQGILEWLDGDSSPKTFEVFLIFYNETQGDKTFNVTLSNPTGGATLGTPSTATVTIQEGDCEELHGTISANRTLDKSCYLVTGDVFVSGANLRVNPGVLIIFEQDTGLQVDFSGSLTAEGTSDNPILFTGKQRSRGYWKAIEFKRSNNSENMLVYVTIEYGGNEDSRNANLLIGSGTLISIKHCTIQESETYGFFIEDDTNVTFEANTLTKNTKGAVYANADAVGSLDSNSQYTGNDQEIVFVFGGTIEQDQTWPNIGQAYYEIDSYIIVNAILTISKATTLKFAADQYLEVSSDGALKADGEDAEHQIVFTGKQATRGYWEGIIFSETNDTSNKLNYVVVEYGGKGDRSRGNVYIYTNNGICRVNITHTTLRQSKTYGFVISDEAEGTFSNNIITGNELGAGWINPNKVHLLDKATDYSGNDKNIINITPGSSVGSSNVETPQTWPKLNGAYYYTEYYIIIETDLTIEPGVTINFKSLSSVNGAYLDVEGSLTATGDAANRITFNGESGLAGTWDGIEFYDTATGTFNWVNVYHGGGPRNEANIYLGGNSEVWVDNSDISYSNKFGVYVYDGTYHNGSGNTYISNPDGNDFVD